MPFVNGAFFNALWDGTQAIRAADTPALIDSGFDLFATHITPAAVTDPASDDAKWLDACKAAGVRVLIVPNALQPAQIKTLSTKYGDTLFGWYLQDDANNMKPAELQAALAAQQPTVGTLPACITVAKGTNHAQYGAITPLYHVQNYLGRVVRIEPLKTYAYDQMLQARAACPGKLLGSMFLAKTTTPYGFRTSPFYRRQDYLWPSQQEAIAWLQIIAGADHLLSYTAYEISKQNPLVESRLADNLDLLEAYKAINGRIKSLDRFLSVGVRTTRVEGKNCIGEWKLASGEKLTVTVDLTSDFYPRTDWQIETPIPSVSTTVRITSSGPVRVETLP